MARPRKIVQIATCGVDNAQSTQCNAFLYALCADGSLFGRCNNEDAWWQIPSVPDAPDTVEQNRHIAQQLNGKIGCSFYKGYCHYDKDGCQNKNDCRFKVMQPTSPV